MTLKGSWYLQCPIAAFWIKWSSWDWAASCPILHLLWCKRTSKVFNSNFQGPFVFTFSLPFSLSSYRTHRTMLKRKGGVCDEEDDVSRDGSKDKTRQDKTHARTFNSDTSTQIWWCLSLCHHFSTGLSFYKVTTFNAFWKCFFFSLVLLLFCCSFHRSRSMSWNLSWVLAVPSGKTSDAKPLPKQTDGDVLKKGVNRYQLPRICDLHSGSKYRETRLRCWGCVKGPGHI